MVVHSEDGLDELSIANETHVAELKDGHVSTYTIHPNDFDIQLGDLEKLKAENASESLALITDAFAGNKGPHRDIIALNAGAAIYVSGIEDSLDNGILKACELLSDGGAQAKLDAYILASNS